MWGKMCVECGNEYIFTVKTNKCLMRTQTGGTNFFNERTNMYFMWE